MAEMEKKFRGKLQRAALRPSEFFEVVRQHPELQTFNDLVGWAQLQRSQGVKLYQDFMARQGGRMAPLFASWKELLAMLAD